MALFEAGLVAKLNKTGFAALSLVALGRLVDDPGFSRRCGDGEDHHRVISFCCISFKVLGMKGLNRMHFGAISQSHSFHLCGTLSVTLHYVRLQLHLIQHGSCFWVSLGNPHWESSLSTVLYWESRYWRDAPPDTPAHTV